MDEVSNIQWHYTGLSSTAIIRNCKYTFPSSTIQKGIHSRIVQIPIINNSFEQEREADLSSTNALMGNFLLGGSQVQQDPQIRDQGREWTVQKSKPQSLPKFLIAK